MTTKEAVALLERYSNYDGMGIPNLVGCKEAMRVAVDALKEAYPELAESEDERIRKDIIALIEFGLTEGGAVSPGSRTTKEEALAYLEKLKEQSLRNFIDDFPYSIEQKEQEPYEPHNWPTDKNNLTQEQKPEITLVGDGSPLRIIDKSELKMTLKEAIENLKLFRYRAIHSIKLEDSIDVVVEYLEKEKKLVEWSEDYREEDIQTRFAFYTYKDELGTLYLSNVFVEEASRNHGFETKILRAAEKVAETIGATTICLKVKQDSPANAWYRKNGYGYVAFEDGYDWLEKNLEYMKPQPKQEWSKEDKDNLNRVIRVLEDNDSDWKELSNWLKSLRPSWKPSKEQMEAIEHAYNSFPNDCPTKSNLKLLYFDLKKL